MIPTPCTTPDAPFYKADLVILSFMENTIGVDMSCGATLATGTTLLTLAVAIPAFCFIAAYKEYAS